MDPDDLTYHVVRESGARGSLEFLPVDDGLDLLYRRWRFRSVDD